MHTGILLALNLEERCEEAPLVLENLLVVVEYIPQEVINASLAGVREGKLGCAKWADEELVIYNVKLCYEERC